MSKLMRYRKAPKEIGDAIADAKLVTDFLPPPSRLLAKEETTSTQVRVSKHTMRFFRQQAKRYRTSAQSMMRKVMDTYAQQFSKK